MSGIRGHQCPEHQDSQPCQLFPGHDFKWPHCDSDGIPQHVWLDNGHRDLVPAPVPGGMYLPRPDAEALAAALREAGEKRELAPELSELVNVISAWDDPS
jgi:hypothetical protein